MSAPVILTIGGVSYPSVQQENFQISTIQGQTVSTLTGTIYDKNSHLAIPGELTDVIVTRSDTGARIFGGLLSTNTGRIEGLSRYWDINAQSYTILLNKIIFRNDYNTGYVNPDHPTYPGDLAVLANLFEKSVVSRNGIGFAPSEIIVSPTYCQSGLSTIGALQFVYTYAQEAVSQLATYVGFNYYVDYNKYLHYYGYTTIPAPFNLSDTPNGTTTLSYRGLTRKVDASRIINCYMVYGMSLPSNIQTSYLGNDGTQTVLSTGGLPGSQFGLGAPPGQTQILVWVNTGTQASPVWAAKTVGVAGLNSLSSFNCLFDAVANSLTFAVAPPNIAVPSSNISGAVQLQYIYTYVGGQPFWVANSITQYGREFWQRIIASDANSMAGLSVNLQNLERQFSSPLEVLNLSVSDDDFPVGNTNRFNVGQYLLLQNSILGISGGYWIHSITTTVLGGQLKEYKMELRNYVLE
jgi:hypothetical protein